MDNDIIPSFAFELLLLSVLSVLPLLVLHFPIANCPPKQRNDGERIRGLSCKPSKAFLLWLLSARHHFLKLRCGTPVEPF